MGEHPVNVISRSRSGGQRWQDDCQLRELHFCPPEFLVNSGMSLRIDTPVSRMS